MSGGELGEGKHEEERLYIEHSTEQVADEPAWENSEESEQSHAETQEQESKYKTHRQEIERNDSVELEKVRDQLAGKTPESQSTEEQETPNELQDPGDETAEHGNEAVPEGSAADWVDMEEDVEYRVSEEKPTDLDQSGESDGEVELASAADTSRVERRGAATPEEHSEHPSENADAADVSVDSGNRAAEADETNRESDVSDQAERPLEPTDADDAAVGDHEQSDRPTTTFESDARSEFNDGPDRPDAAAQDRLDKQDAAARREAVRIEGEPQPGGAPDGRDVTPVFDDVASQRQSDDSDLDDASRGSDIDQSDSDDVREAEKGQQESFDRANAEQKPPAEDSAAIDDGVRDTSRSTDRAAADDTGPAESEGLDEREESELGTETVDDGFRDHLDAAGLPEGWEVVPLSRIDVSDSSVGGPENFGKGYSPEDLKWAFEALDEVVLPGLAEGRGPDYFEELDAAEGRVGARSYSDTYHGFFKDFKGDPSSAISLDARSDGTYDVNNGYHRIWVAQQLGRSGVPAFVSRRNAR